MKIPEENQLKEEEAKLKDMLVRRHKGLEEAARIYKEKSRDVCTWRFTLTSIDDQNNISDDDYFFCTLEPVLSKACDAFYEVLDELVGYMNNGKNGEEYWKKFGARLEIENHDKDGNTWLEPDENCWRYPRELEDLDDTWFDEINDLRSRISFLRRRIGALKAWEKRRAK